MTVPIRLLDDPKAIRALAHPVRLALLELLMSDGPLTASQCAEPVGESPSSCSFHLRQLAKYGYIEESPGGKGRERPWRAVHELQNIPTTDSSELMLATAELKAAFTQRWVQMQDRWRHTQATYPLEWRKAATSANSVLQLTVEQAEQMKAELVALLDRWAEVGVPDPGQPKPEGSVPVAFQMQTFPLRMPS